MCNPTFSQAVREFLGRFGQRSNGASPRFAVKCDCGHTLRGERQKAFQNLECPECGQRVFVLASNPRPVPKLRRGMQAAFDESIDVLDSAPASAVSTIDDPVPATTPDRPPPSTTDSVDEAGLFPRLARPSFTRRWFTVPRITALCVLLLLLGTAWGTWRQRQFRIYSAQLETATEEGLKRLKAADFVNAAELLGQADRAATGLGANTSRERLAVQLHRESRLWLHLSREPLAAFVAEFDAAGADDTANLSEQFRRQFGNSTLVFDVWVSPPTEAEIAEAKPEDTPSHHADWIILGQQAQLRLSLRGLAMFDRFELREPRRFIFGAKISGLAPTEQPGLWSIELAPGSEALVTIAEPLLHFGWPADESLDEILISQSQLLGIDR